MKKITHYIVNIGHSTQTKNKLQLEFLNYLNTLSGVLVEEKQKNDLICKIIEKSVELSQKYSRCTPISVHFDECYDKTGLKICGFYYMSVKLLYGYYESN
ncbi:hypothetical protein [Flavobacterium sp.]|uniref:hypothetical protein n=1 Tax=Flavobacterium sp. TaxID=239 RepID=UPI0037536491